MFLMRNAVNRVRRLVDRGELLGKAINTVSMEYNGRALGEGHFLALSVKTLIRFWYRWADQQDDAALELHWHGPASQRIPLRLLRDLEALALRYGLSCVEVHKLAADMGVSYPTVVRAISDEVKKAVLLRKRVDRLCVRLAVKREGAGNEGNRKQGGCGVRKLDGDGQRGCDNPLCRCAAARAELHGQTPGDAAESEAGVREVVT